jgi:hypothetical protein
MAPHTPWDWCKSLGAVSADAALQFGVGRIRLGMVMNRCWEIGLREGQEIRCRHRSKEEVTIELPGGEVRSLELPYAWFVEVRPIASDADNTTVLFQMGL